MDRRTVIETMRQKRSEFLLRSLKKLCLALPCPDTHAKDLKRRTL